jgi:hypothetical protein
MARIATLLILIGATLAAGPAAAQFGGIFGGPPPRPPADVPNGPFPPQPPPVGSPEDGPQYPQAPQYPGQASPPAYPAPPQSAIEAQPLPPPPGATTAPGRAPVQPAPTQRALATPPAASPPPAAQAPTPPPDDTVVEEPTPHIDNRRAVFSGLDKITGRTISFDVGIGETVQFGALQVTPRACYTRPPTEATNTDAFVDVDEVTLQGQIKRIFTGWMFASSPGLNAVEHPIYDVWLTGCGSPVVAQAVEPAEPAAPPGQPHPPARARRPPAPPPALNPQPH